jgi:hypothetical protein
MKHLLLFESYHREEMDIKSLREYLLKFGIPLGEWGIGYAKTIDHLLSEIKSGECLITEKGKNIIREIEFVMAEIFYEDGERIFKLVEDRQVFSDGRTRVRKKESSISEKMIIGEDPLESLIRGAKEELGIYLEKNQIEKKEKEEKFEISKSFPGLTTKYNGHRFICFLNKDQYNSEGYLEIQKDKKTYFVWEEYNF